MGRHGLGGNAQSLRNLGAGHAVRKPKNHPALGWAEAEHRAQAVALTVFTASVVTILGTIAVCERPLYGSHQVAAAPLYAAVLALKQ